MIKQYIIAIVILITCTIIWASSTPVIGLKDFWMTMKGAQTVNCSFNECFPKKLDATVICDSRCLFTSQGYGTPEAQSRAFTNKRSRKGTIPKFMIAYGPPASGKSEILRILQQKIGDEFRDLTDSTILVNVDDIFQKGTTGEAYKTYRNNIVAKYGEQANLYTQRLYATFRWVGDQISDAILNQALAGRFNILWETTGATDWPMQEVSRVNNYDYDTIVVYPVVGVDELIKRASLRAKIEGQEAAPEESIRSAVESAQQNLVGLLPLDADLDKVRPACDAKKMPAAGDQRSCRAKRVIIIDNTGDKGAEKIAFDSKNPKNYCEPLKALHSEVKLNKLLFDALKVLAPQCGLFQEVKSVNP